MRELSQLAVARSLRRFLYNGAFWGAYAQLVAVTGPIFTGYALWMGLRESDIAAVASVVALGGLVQPFSFMLVRRLRDQKAFVVGVGVLEISLVILVLLVPFLASTPGARLVLAACLILAGTFMSHLVSPLYNSWFSTLLPEEVRARFLGRRMVLVSVSAMAIGYLSGRFLDATQGRYSGFSVLYLFAWIVGVGGYWLLVKVPFPSYIKVDRDISLGRVFVSPFRHPEFGRLLAFYLAWAFAALIANPFYNVFMIRDLSISYTTIGVFNVIYMAMMVLGYRLWGSIVERFGSKPVLQVLMVPRALLPLIWATLTRGNAIIILPVIMVLNGLTFSGLTVAVNTLLFGTVPEGGERSAFFASWAFSNSLVASAASGLGGVLARALSDHEVSLDGVSLNNIKLIFLITAVLLCVPLYLLRRVSDVKAKPAAYLLGQVLRGNPFAFAYNAFLFSHARGFRWRARAARAMGRSRSPMAVERLVRAMDDASPEVRVQAVKGLGETGAEEAVEPLVQELSDEESDIRAEAAEALGKLRHPRGIEPLFRALDSGDVRVQISAVRALGDIGGEEVRERLYRKLRGAFDRLLFPTLVETLSRLGDLRVVESALEGLRHYRSPVIRLQLLNAVCRTLGARDRFYRLLYSEELELTERLYNTLEGLRKRLRGIPPERRARASVVLRELEGALEEGRYGDMPDLALRLAEELDGEGDVARAGLLALRLFCECHREGKAERPEIFSVVCLDWLAEVALWSDQSVAAPRRPWRRCMRPGSEVC
ncbi:MAG TPA: MFS transporter [Candidatus Latescibacteria bacterium]|nr:MFS transporter [Candidatus Latescibacterota bacterium]